MQSHDTDSATLIGAEQAARRLGLRKDQIYRYAAERIVPAVRVGRLLRFDPRALDEFVESGGQTFAGGWRREAPESEPRDSTA